LKKDLIKNQLIVYIVDIGNSHLKSLQHYFDDTALPVSIVSTSMEEVGNEAKQDSSLLLIDADLFGGSQINFNDHTRASISKIPCIGLFAIESPDPSVISAHVNLRDLIHQTNSKQIVFAVVREINTLILEKELKRKNSLLKATGKSELLKFPKKNPEILNDSRLQKIAPSYILNREEFLLYLDEQVYLLNQNEHVALALIEIDHYKSAPESGDEFQSRYMSIVANIILSRCSPSDIIGNFSSNVFALFSTRYSPKTVAPFAEHLRYTIAESLVEDESQFFQLKCSIGICFWSTHIANTKELVARTQQACVKAKMGDGNQVQIYQTLATSFDVLEEQSKYKDQISAALKENRFRLVYQPIVNLKQYGEENYAILLRMIDRSGKNLSPDRFLPIAENTGLISYIDQWVIQQTVELAKRSVKQKKKRNFFLKVSGYSLNSEKLMKCLVYYLKTAKIDGYLLVFQIDYSQFINYPDRVKLFIDQVSSLNCRIAFDHFGFGAFSVDELRELPVDFIKIDGTFSRGLQGKPAHVKTIEKIQLAAQTCNIKTIAKSVENADTLAMLWNLEVDAVQGYFIQEPNDNMRFDFTAV